MCQRTKQIVRLHEMGNSAKDIAEMLEYDIADVELILNAVHLCNSLKVPVQSKALVATAIQPQNSDSSTSRGNSPQPPLNSDNSISKDADTIFKDNHARVAQRLVNIALYEHENVSAAVKAGVYVVEEATGRNDAKAKRQNNLLLLNVGETLLQIKKAKDAVSKAIDVEGVVQNLIAA